MHKHILLTSTCYARIMLDDPLILASIKQVSSGWDMHNGNKFINNNNVEIWSRYKLYLNIL